MVNSGGGTLVMSDTATNGNLVSAFTGTLGIAGGTVELASAAAVGSGGIAFITGSPGTLQIDGVVMPALAFDERCGAAAAWASEACAPLVTCGPALDAIRARLGAAQAQELAIDRPGQYRLTVTAGGGLVRLRSRRGWAVGDARPLGAAVTTAAVDGAPLPLGGPAFADGFHPAEAAWIWTDGAGTLALGACPAERSLVIEVTAVGALIGHAA